MNVLLLFFAIINLTIGKHSFYEISSNQSKLNYSKASVRDARDVDCFGFGATSARVLELFYYKLHDHSMDEKKIQFYLTTRLNRGRSKIVSVDKMNLKKIGFNIQRRTIIIVHGFLSHGRETWIREMEKALLLWNNVNLIAVDWGAIANTWNYYDAAVHTDFVGSMIVKLLTNIIKVQKVPSTKPIKWGPIHMIGHSLGSHICSEAAYALTKISTKWQVTRLTGLDPAQPCFMQSDMHKSNKMFIDIIHTNGRMLAKLGLGLPNPTGHMDFYPNGGMVQLGCTPQKTPVNNSFKFFGEFINSLSAIKTAICSHGRAHEYFTESILEAHYKTDSFVGKPWDRTYKGALKMINVRCKKNQCPEMGINAEKYPQRGSFFVETSRSPPYSVVTWSDLKYLKQYLQQHLKDD